MEDWGLEGLEDAVADGPTFPGPPLGQFVLHCDVDAFFVQAEQLRDPSLQGKAVAVQQHQDIIAANSAAMAAGVRKHCAPAEARRLLAAVGGRVAHVHLEAGGRVSYKPYRALSRRLMQLLRRQPWVSVVEQASIDEAFVLLSGGPGGGGVAPAAALQRAEELKAAAKQELGLTVSVGAAPSRLLSKLASAAAKPDGIRLVPDLPAALQLLAQTPARRLPGYGGKAAEEFGKHGVGAATDLQRYSQPQLEQLFGLKPTAAALLAQWCRGLDPTPVQDRGPPKSLSVQMSLTPQLLRMHPTQGPDAVSAAGGRAGVLEPLVVGRPDFRPRVRQLAGAMGTDLLERVLEDSADEARWPRTLTATLRAMGGGRDGSALSRSGAFPARTLAQQPRRQQQPGQPAPGQAASAQQQQQPQAQAQAQAQQQQQTQQQQAQQQQAQAADPLESALVQALEQLVQQAAGTLAPTARLVELRFAASSFQPLAAATAAAPITRFFAAAPVGGSGRQQQQQQQRQQREEEQRQQHGPGKGPPPASPDHAGLPEQQRQQQAQQQQQPQQQRQPEGASDDVDLSSVDIREQQYILAQLQRQQQVTSAAVKARAGGGGGGKRRAAAPPADSKQPKIMSFLGRK